MHCTNFSKMIIRICLFAAYILQNVCIGDYNNKDEINLINIFESSSINNNEPKKNLNITVFYESLCPDSIDFFKNQFSRNWRSFYGYLNVELVPYGKANQTKSKSGNYQFTCQHGEDECFGNRIQACAISKMYKEHRKQLFGFISCYMSHYTNQEKNGPKCASKYNVSWMVLKRCANGKEGFNLLAKLGNRTHNFKPKITYIPTIVFNNMYDEDDNYVAASDLKSLLCIKLDNKPKKCWT
ncbi:hypothetical protein PGB90_009583 [Kerria lacca]